MFSNTIRSNEPCPMCSSTFKLNLWAEKSNNDVPIISYSCSNCDYYLSFTESGKTIKEEFYCEVDGIHFYLEFDVNKDNENFILTSCNIFNKDQIEINAGKRRSFKSQKHLEQFIKSILMLM